MTSSVSTGEPATGTGRADPRLLAAGVAGSVLLAASSWSVGAVPHGWRNELGAVPWAGYYVGLAVLCVSWLVLGLRVRARAVAPGDVGRYALAVAAPLLAAAPFGRDLWAYAAQGQVTGRGLDPYSVGPASVPGVFADEVSMRWLSTPSPYGPAWLRVSQFGSWLADGDPAIAALLLRLPAYLGLALTCWAVCVLAQRFGARADLALWLGPGCPLMIVLGVGGGHNDLLALGLALTGLAVASGGGSRAVVSGAAVVGLAVMIKSPALIALAFVVPVALHTDPSRPSARRVLTACVLAVVPAVVVTALVTAASGLGSGWTRQVGADAPWTSVLSLPTAVGMFGRALTGRPVREVDGLIHTSRTVGEVLAVVIVAGLWVFAVRRGSGQVLGLLAGATAAAVLLAPTVQPWYYLWAIVPAALVARRHASFVGLATVGLLFPIMIMPSGHGWESDLRFPLAAAAVLLVVVLVFRRRASMTPSLRPGSGSTAYETRPNRYGRAVRAR